MDEWTDWPEGVEDPREQVELAIEVCGCSETDDLLRLVRDVLALLDAEDWNGVRRLLRYDTDKAHYYIVLNWLDELNVIEHGTAIRCAWPTDKGRAVLAKLREVITDAPEGGG